MKRRVIGICLLSLSCLNAFSNEAVKQRDRIQEVADDLVLHYDRAVVLGTSNPEYIKGEQQRLGERLKENLTAENCGDIDLYSCAINLLCSGEMPIGNLHPDLLPCYN